MRLTPPESDDPDYKGFSLTVLTAVDHYFLSLHALYASMAPE